MAYSVVPTAVTGDLWTAANHNTYIKDNFAAGVPGIFTAAGDLFYATAANAGAALAIGTALEVLKVNAAGDAPEWASIFSGCHVSLTTDQEIDEQVYTKIVFDTQIYDTNSYWSTDNTDGFVIPADGVYQCSGTIEWETIPSTSANDIQVEITVGTQIIDATITQKGYTAARSFQYISRFTTADDPFLRVYKTGDVGATLAVTAANYQITYLGAST